MKVHFIQLLLGVTTVLFAAACSRAEWPVTREMCGRIQVADNQSKTTLKGTDLILYRSRSKNIRCCSDADRIADIQTDANGGFNTGRLDAGRYFVEVKNSPQIVFPVYLETSYDGAKCSLNTVFSFNRSTGKTEQTVVLVQTQN